LRMRGRYCGAAQFVVPMQASNLLWNTSSVATIVADTVCASQIASTSTPGWLQMVSAKQPVSVPLVLMMLLNVVPAAGALMLLEFVPAAGGMPRLRSSTPPLIVTLPIELILLKAALFDVNRTFIVPDLISRGPVCQVNGEAPFAG